jgi:uncharacterized membrane protein
MLKRTTNGPANAMRALERASALDPASDKAQELLAPVLGNVRVRAALRGTWFGHALHPMLTDLPLGSFLSVNLLDLFGGERSRSAATGLLTFGVAMALPTAVTGLAEWYGLPRREQRVGLVHAGLNVTVLALYGSSLLCRLKGLRKTAVGLGVAGGTVAMVSGYLGGLLSLARKIGTVHPAISR